ncbi:Hypothetical predicted protein, partial [Paramuricea clavata]
ISSSLLALKTKFSVSCSRLESFLDEYKDFDSSTTRASVASSISCKMEKILEALTRNFELFCEAIPEDDSSESASSSEVFANLLSKSDKFSIVLDTIIADNNPTPKPRADPTKSSKLPKVDIRPFDEVNPEIWFDQLSVQFKAAQILDEQQQFAS